MSFSPSHKLIACTGFRRGGGHPGIDCDWYRNYGFQIIFHLYRLLVPTKRMLEKNTNVGVLWVTNFVICRVTVTSVCFAFDTHCLVLPAQVITRRNEACCCHISPFPLLLCERDIVNFSFPYCLIKSDWKYLQMPRSSDVNLEAQFISRTQWCNSWFP